MSTIVLTIFIFIALIAGCGIGYLIFRYVITGRYKQMINDANKEANVIKEKKLLEVKEKFLSKKMNWKRKSSRVTSVYSK